MKTKEQTWEAYKFSRHPAEELSVAAQNLADGTWNVKGYTPFKVYHPTRIINAPKYIDRIVEQWFVEKYLQPKAVAVVLEGKHFCMMARGVEKKDAIMKTSDFRGKFKTDIFCRQELFNLINKN